MERVENHIKEYNRRYMNDTNTTNAGAFYIRDYEKIKELSSDEYTLIDNALKVGFIVGYNKAKREKRKHRRRTSH